MPIYEYKCEKCGHGFEALIRSSSDKVDACPKCGANKVTKQFSSFSASVAATVPSCHSCPTGGGGGPSPCAGGSCPFT